MARTFPYRVERLNASNILDLIPLYREVFGKHVTPTYVTKKYDTAYLKVGFLGHIAYEGDKPVGYYGAVPFRITYQGQTELAAQSGDAMTRPGYAGKGIFTHLGELTDALLVDEKVRFVYGWPNQNSYFGYVKKLHWVHKENMQRYAIPVRSLPLEKASRALKVLRPWYEQRSARILDPLRSGHSRLDSSVVDSAWGGTLRDEAFFRYKSFLGNRLCEVAGVPVWLKADTRLLVGDMAVLPDAELLPVLQGLKQLAARLGLREVVFQVSPGAPLDRFFSRHVPPIESWAIGYKNYSSDFPLDRLRFTYGDLDTF
ncbi:MAG: GNAT family N-acetyltransferase [Bacteroidota bacterium]